MFLLYFKTYQPPLPYFLWIKYSVLQDFSDSQTNDSYKTVLTLVHKKIIPAVSVLIRLLNSKELQESIRGIRIRTATELALIMIMIYQQLKIVGVTWNLQLTWVFSFSVLFTCVYRNTYFNTTLSLLFMGSLFHFYIILFIINI